MVSGGVCCPERKPRAEGPRWRQAARRAASQNASCRCNSMRAAHRVWHGRACGAGFARAPRARRRGTHMKRQTQTMRTMADIDLATVLPRTMTPPSLLENLRTRKVRERRMRRNTARNLTSAPSASAIKIKST